jgi:DNA repair protein RadC
MQLAQAILARFGSLEQLAQATVNELCQVKGVGMAKAIQLRAAFNLGQRLSRHVGTAKVKIDHPAQVYHLVKDELQFEKREIVMVVLQDSKGCVVGQHVIAIGSLTGAHVHPREVFSPAIRHSAASLILVHNHPSGDLTPSKQDTQLTKQLIDAGRLMGIPLNDHLIVSERGYVSLRQKGGISFSE